MGRKDLRKKWMQLLGSPPPKRETPSPPNWDSNPRLPNVCSVTAIGQVCSRCKNPSQRLYHITVLSEDDRIAEVCAKCLLGEGCAAESNCAHPVLYMTGSNELVCSEHHADVLTCSGTLYGKPCGHTAIHDDVPGEEPGSKCTACGVQLCAACTADPDVTVPRRHDACV